MQVLVTGGAGFLGMRLVRALLDRGRLGRDGVDQRIEGITVLDVTAPQALRDDRLTVITGDISDRALIERVVTPEIGVVYHLAAVVSAMAEAEFDLGLRINVDATRLLLDACRKSASRPVLVFTSSVAVFGGELPETVLDTTAPRPQSSYGTQKAIGELLVADYTRKGFVDGRVLRLPTITVRPGRPNAAASSFASGIVREPLNGEHAVCPVDPATRLWVMSPATAIACLTLAGELPAERLGSDRVINLPGLCVTPAGMVASLARIAGPDVAARVGWQREPRIERIVASWPGAWDTARALSLGFPADESIDGIVSGYVEESRGRPQLLGEEHLS
jgi:nucleoside-diphosphate-sugar epimerase